MISTKTAAEKFGISPRRVRVLCEQGRIRGATKIGRDWMIPNNPVISAPSQKK